MSLIFIRQNILLQPQDFTLNLLLREKEKMKFHEMIKTIPENEWIEVLEKGTKQYTSLIGKVPKFLIKGPVLDYEVLSETTINNNEFTTHRIVVSI